nr:ulp1 protease family, C-terminal catalytic domain-containing protein [Tanacetum cinerariifolium]
MKHREKLEIEKYGRFGMLPKKEALNLQSELNMFREKFKETTTGIDNDDTTGIDKESDSLDWQMESDSPASNDDNQKNDKVGDSCPATGVCSVTEGDEVKLSEVKDVEKEKQQIGNEDDRFVDDSDTTNPDSAIVQESFERSEHTLEKEKKKISNEELRSQSLKGDVGAKVAVDSQHTIEDIFKQDEQIQSAEDVGCSIQDLDDAKLDVYNGPDLRSPYEYLPVDVKKPVSDVEKIVADTLFAMIGSKLDLIFESQSGFGLNHLEMETLTPTLMVSTYVIDVWAELLNILEIYKDESLPLRYFFKITVYIPVYYIGKDTDDKKEKFMKLVQAFEQKTEEERKKTIDDAIANRDHRE